MASNVGNIKVKLNLDSAAYEYGLKQCVSATKTLGTVLAGLGVGFGAAKITEGIKNIAANALKASSDFEQAGVQFGVMLGDAKKAQRLVNEIQDMANVTPFETQDLLDASKTLLNFGINVQDILPDLRMLGDIAGGDKQRMQSLTLAFSQMSSAGRLMGQDLLQMINAGFNPLQVISEKTGKSMAVLKDEMSKGKISVEMVRQAFVDATSEGGKFYGMMNKQSETLEGKISTLNDAYTIMTRTLSDMMIPSLKEGVEEITEVVRSTTEAIKSFQSWAAQNQIVVGGLKDAAVAIAALAVGIPITNAAVVTIMTSMRNFGTVTAATNAYQIAFATYLKGDAALALIQFRSAIQATIIQVRALTVSLLSCPLTWVTLALGAGAAAWWAYRQAAQETTRAIEELNNAQNEQANKTTEAIRTLKELQGVKNLDYNQTKRLDEAIAYLTEKYPKYIGRLKEELRLKGAISKATAEQIANEMTLAKVKELTERKQKIDKKVASAVKGYKQNQLISAARFGTPIDTSDTGRKGASRQLQRDQDLVNKELENVKKEREAIINGLTALNTKASEVPSVSTSTAGTDKKKKTDKQLAAEEKARQKEALDYKLALLDVEKYSTQKNEEEIYKIELQKAELRLAATKQGTSEYAQALADKLQLERDYEKNVRALQSSKVVDDLTFNKQEIDNKIAVLQLEYDAHKISKSRMLQTEIEYINQKKNLELAALQEQLKMVEGNAAEEIKIKRNSQRIMEEYNLEANRKTLELWEHEHEAFKNVTSDITSGWGSTVSDLINGNLTFEGALNSMLDTVLNSFGNMCGQMVQTWLGEHLTMESVMRLFGIQKAATDQAMVASNGLIIGSNAARMQSEMALAGTGGFLNTENGLLIGSNLAVATSAGTAATAQGVAAGEMAASSGVMGSAITAIIAPITALAGAMATLALSSGAVATNMAIIAVSTGLFTLEAALASLTATLLSASLGILAATSTIAAKAMATLAIANAANSAAMIPFIGWAIAPGAALSTGASIMAADSLVQFREKGGEVKKGQPYIVGEKRPELFIPDRNGRIEPNLNSLNGGGGDAGSTTYNNYSTNITVQAIDTKDFKQRVGELTPYIHQNLQSGIKKRQLESLGGK